MIKKTFRAKIDTLPDVLGFVEHTLELYDCPIKTQTAICVAIEEVFVNIAYYAYGEEDGNMELGISFDIESHAIIFHITDNGIPFDPLKKPEPNITLAVEEREIGGFGLFIVKNTMDEMNYAYENGKNILTMIKTI